MIRWAHVPVFFAVISIVGFVRLYLRAGRPWLGYTVCGLRLLVLIINFLSAQDRLSFHLLHGPGKLHLPARV